MRLGTLMKLRGSRIADLHQIEGPLHLALGVFDGVHLGHQAVIGSAVKGARKSGGLAGVLTFEPHPIQVLRPELAPRRILASLDHKERLLSSLGVEVLLVLGFNLEMADQPAEEFAEELLSISCLRQLVAGEDWAFGRKREGTMEMLARVGARYGVEVSAVEAVMLQGVRISSTRLRHALCGGDLRMASEMLGRPYTVMGTVERGEQLGRRLGWPTANIGVGDEQLPPDGVYAVVVRSGEGKLQGIANLGKRPTVEGHRRLLEVHLLDFEGDLYGSQMEVCFGAYVREERQFETVGQLQEQIQRDVAEVRMLFGRGQADFQ